MGCFRPSQRRSKSREPPNKLLKMVAGLASCSSSSREKEIPTKASSSSFSSMPRESSDSAPNDGISPPRMSDDFHSMPSSMWPESSPSRSPHSAAARASSSRGTPMPLPLPLKRQQQQQPLPLPKPTSSTSPKLSRIPSTSPTLSRTPSRPHPLPLPAAEPSIGLRSFDFEHLARLCRNFSPQCQIRAGSLGPVYRCSMVIDDTGSSRELDVVRITNKPLQHHQDDQQVEEWVAKLKLITQLEHDTLCKLIGFSVKAAAEGVERLLVLESSGSGESVDKLLAAAAKNQVLDWDARIKIALGAARGLAYLHNKVAYPSSFGSSNVLVDKDCNVKLLVVDYEDWDEAAAPSCQKANVRSYGILLLELLTGKQQMERLLPQGRDLVQWARPFVNDTAKLSSILDPRLGQCPTTRGVKDLANFALNCLYSDPRLRPTMREAVALLKALALATTASSKNKEPLLFGRSATFAMRPAISSNNQRQHYQARSAGASPARYASPLSSASFFSCSSEEISSRQRRRTQFSR